MRACKPVEQGEVARDGVRIAWQRFGDRGPWVLFVPTWHLVDSQASKMQVAHLARRFRVLTYDPRGNGRSDRPARGYRIEDHADDALAVLDHHGAARAAVVTASQGTNPAIWFAAEHPDRVERLVLVGEALGIGPAPEVVAFLQRDFERFIGGFFAASFNEPHSTKVIEDAVGWARQTTPEVIAAGQAEFDADLARGRLGDVVCPVLLVHGEQDLIVAADHAREVAAALPDAKLVLVQGGGHRPDLRDPVLVNDVLDAFLGPGETPRERRVVRGPGRAPRKALFLSSPIGLGHVHRDLAIADALRERVEDLEIQWLVQPPSLAVLEAAGEHVHPASAQLAEEVAHVESHLGEHRLPIFRAWRDLDDHLVANFMVFADVVRETAYDLWIGDEAWEIDHFLHQVPERKTAPYAFLTDFVGWAAMDDAEAAIVTDHNAEMVEQVERHPWVRDAALFLGEPGDVVDREFGPGLPVISEWVAERFDFPGYVLPRDLASGPRGDGPPLVVAAVGGTTSGRGLLDRVVAAFALLRDDVPDARMLAVCGPRIDPSALDVPDGVEVAGFVEDLPRVLGSCDLAVVQGGLATTMELVAARRPFVWVPLRDHCEQQVHVAHRLARHGAPPPTPFDDATPQALAALMLERLRADVAYLPVPAGAAGRVADALASLLHPRSGIRRRSLSTTTV